MWVKNSGSSKHHDQIIGDFDGDGKMELVFWNQGANKLFMADIPANPKDNQSWHYTEIFLSPSQSEGLAKIDVDGDGKIDIVGGGRWFKHKEGTNFVAQFIDDKQRFSRVAVGQLVSGGRPEVVFVVGDGVGSLKWYEWTGESWREHDLLDFDVDQGHSLEVADFNNDGKLDIFCGEMRLNGLNKDAKIWIFFGNGKGQFLKETIAVGYGVHEAKVDDLDGDGDLDILGKPYNWDTPRLDIWLNNLSGKEIRSSDHWQRHIIDPEKPWRSLFITAADIDSDGDKDIITGGWWYKNPGNHEEHWQRRTIGEPLYNMAIVYDFDNDGDNDVLGTQGIGSKANAEFLWAHNNGKGTFTILNNIPPGDGDFLQGIAVARFQEKNINVALSWHQYGKGIQLFTVPVSPSAKTWTWERISAVSQDECLSAGDIDSDGKIDLLLGTEWLRNNGGSWSIYELYESSDKPDRNRLADINGDGKLDAVVGFG